jgi:hypothetical protein
VCVFFSLSFSFTCSGFVCFHQLTFFYSVQQRQKHTSVLHYFFRKTHKKKKMLAKKILLSVAFLATMILILQSSSSSSSSSSLFVEACNNTYCSYRGNGTNTSGTRDNCTCMCEWPYFGYRCYYQYTTGNASAVIDCNATFGSDEALCDAHPQCYWRTETSTCDSNVLPPYSSNMPSSQNSLETPWCYRLIPLPAEVTVYCLATAAFGVGGIGFFYMMRYRNTYSVVEENGERMFNQFYDNHWFTTIYCFLLFASSGCLAITAYVNFRDPRVCSYVYFFIIYLVIQALAIMWPLKWIVQFFAMRWSSPDKKMIDLDFHTRPIKKAIEHSRKSCQVRSIHLVKKKEAPHLYRTTYTHQQQQQMIEEGSSSTVSGGEDENYSHFKNE